MSNDENAMLAMYINVYSSRSEARSAEPRGLQSRRARSARVSHKHRKASVIFLLAINLSSLVGVRLDVIQSSDVKVHYGFPGNRLPSMTKLRVLFMKTGYYGRFPFSQNFRNFRFGGKWNTFRRFVPPENSQKKWKI